MKGVVFTEFFAFVEGQHDELFLQELIDAADLPSKGVYTATGTYPHKEMAKLVATLASRTGADAQTMLKVFGRHLFARFHSGFPEMFVEGQSAFDFLATVGDCIHVEVRKLYPDAELPQLEVMEHRPDRFCLRYSSSRCLGDFCEGLIYGCLDHFGTKAMVSRREAGTRDAPAIDFVIEL
ncbi:MAG: heme NO-binding domain-containing protein [Pseudomonadota bacterium]